MSRGPRYPFSTIVHGLIVSVTRGDYARIEALTLGRRLSAAEIAAAVAEYGATLVDPPTGTDDLVDVVEISGGGLPSWSVDVPLWSAEEGRSDLTLQLTIRARTEGEFDIEVDGLHVL